MADSELKLFNDDIISDGLKWKKTPGYVNLYISETGKVGLLNSKGFLVFPTYREWKTTKGSYYYAQVINDDFIPVVKAVHQLVCKTYKGEPPNDGKIYEPNHLDGNKHNNHPSNLEWETHSGNVLHAYESGLCKTGVRVELIDVKTKEVKVFHSASAFSRATGIQRHELRHLAANHRNIPYRGRWLISLDDSSDKKVNRIKRDPVLFKDYVTGQVTSCEDFQQACLLTGVKAATIAYRIAKQMKPEAPTLLLSRYVFKRFRGEIIWPEFTKEEALQSERKYKENEEIVKRRHVTRK